MVSTTVDASGIGGSGTSRVAPRVLRASETASGILGLSTPASVGVATSTLPIRWTVKGSSRSNSPASSGWGWRSGPPRAAASWAAAATSSRLVSATTTAWSAHGKISPDRARASPATEPVAIGAVPPLTGVQSRSDGVVLTDVAATVVDVGLAVDVVTTEMVSVGVSPTTTLQAARAQRSRRNKCFMGKGTGVRVPAPGLNLGEMPARQSRERRRRPR